MTAKQYLKHRVQALTDGISIRCSTRKCGLCAKIKLEGLVAKQMLRKKTLPKKALAVHSELVWQKWKKMKFYKTYQRAVRMGVDPIEYMRKKGLEP